MTQNPNELLYFNTDAEATVLGEIFFDPENIGKLQLRPEQFYHARNQKLYSYMLKLKDAGKEVNPIEIANIMLSDIEDIGGLQYVTELVMTAMGKNILPLEKLLVELYVRRETVLLNRKMSSDIAEGVDPMTAIDRFNIAFEELQEKNRMDDEDDGHVSKYISVIANEAEIDKGDLVGSPTHYRDIDALLGGIERQTFTIIAARPSVGKTALVMDVCKNHCLMNDGVAVIFSIEMPGKKITERMVSSNGNLDGFKVKNPQRNFNDNEWLKFYKSMGELSTMNMHIFDQTSIDIGFMRRKCKLIADKYPGKHIYIMIDYIQLVDMEGRQDGNVNRQLTILSQQLASLAKDLDASVMALSQLSRTVEQRQDKRPMLSDLRDSGGLEAAADGVWLLYRDDYYDKETELKGLIEIIVAKNRNGAVGTVQLAFKKEYSKFLNVG